VDLEPVPVAIVLADVARRPRHVDGQRARVLHGGVVPQLEAERVAGHDLLHLGAAGVGHGARVAPEVVAGLEELLGRHDAVAVLADVLKVGRQLAVVHRLAEAVVGLGRLRRRQGPEGRSGKAEMHGERGVVGREERRRQERARSWDVDLAQVSSLAAVEEPHLYTPRCLISCPELTVWFPTLGREQSRLAGAVRWWTWASRKPGATWRGPAVF
jgi:hypothetical protein